MVTWIGIIILGLLWLTSWGILLWPFIKHKGGLETFDALDAFMIRQSMLLCLFIFVLSPNLITGLWAVVSLVGSRTFKRSVLWVTCSLISLALTPYLQLLL